MTNREQHTRDLLEAAASSRRVDTEALWHEVQSTLDQPSRRSRRKPVALLAAAAAAAVAGAVIWAGGFTPANTPPASTPSLVVTNSPSPTETPTQTATKSPTQTPRTEPTTTSANPPATAQPPLSTASLLTVEDYVAAGLDVDSVQTGPGSGQATISSCQDDFTLVPRSGWPVFGGDAYPAGATHPYGVGQYAFEFETAADAETVVNDILAWGVGCATLDRAGVQSVGSEQPQRVSLPGGGEGWTYRISIVQPSGTRYTELLAVARNDDRVSLVVIWERDKSSTLESVDVTRLLSRAFERLG